MKKQFGIIYRALFPNGKSYIGQTTRSLHRRINEHLNKVDVFDMVLYRAIKKYGADNIVWNVIDTAENIDELNAKEIYWIGFYHSFIEFEGYNMTLGGGGLAGYIRSKETCEKISAGNKGKKQSKEHVAKLTATRIGKHPGDETRAKMSLTRTGLRPNDETRAKMSASRKQYWARKVAENLDGLGS